MREVNIPLVIGWLQNRPGIVLLDQTLLPREEVILELEDIEAVAESIKALRVRGAPAIGVTAAVGLAACMTTWLQRPENEASSRAVVAEQLERWSDILFATRPTARNLGNMLDRMKSSFAAETPASEADLPVEWAAHPLARELVAEAERIRLEDILMCRGMGDAGLTLLPKSGARILTHCNTGALATAGMGTALAVIYRAFETELPLQVYACEARPVLQGARLTAWELDRAGVDVTLITDSMAGALMAEGKVDLVILGADAVCANGDVVNKIGTYALALLAREHGLPFYVAAPRSTFAPELASANDVPIEEREPDEVRTVFGTQTAPAGVNVWNPAFDRTPSELITAIVTDRGVLRPPYGPAIQKLLSEG